SLSPARNAERRAQPVMHAGEAEPSGAPRSGLQLWLREAGVRVGADGTLTGSASPAPSPAGTGKPPGMDEEEHGSGGGGAGGEPAAPGSRDVAPAAGGGRR